MFPRIVNALAYQRYATQSLYNALVMKKKMMRRMDGEKEMLFDSRIMDIAHDIQTAKNMLRQGTEGVALQEIILSMKDAESSIIIEIIEDISRLETLCMQALAEVKTCAAAVCFSQASPLAGASITIQ